METTALEIRTNSEQDSEEEVNLHFHTLRGDDAGGIEIYLSSTPQYFLKDCSLSRTKFQNNIPSGEDNIWRITKTNTSEDIRLQIHCNDVEVVDIMLSDTVCTEKSKWSTYWGRYAGKITFSPADTASQSYRSFNTGTVLQIVQYRYSPTDRSIQVQSYRSFNTGTVLQIVQYRYSPTDRSTQVHLSKTLLAIHLLS